MLLSVVIYIVGRITCPSPDDIVIHAIDKCFRTKHSIYPIGSSTMFVPSFGRKSIFYPLAMLVEKETKYRVLFYQGKISSHVRLDGNVVAYGAYGFYKIPSCEEIRNFK